MSLHLHTIPLDSVCLDDESVCFAIKSFDHTRIGNANGIVFIRVSRTQFEQLVNIYEAMVHDEEDQPVERSAP